MIVNVIPEIAYQFNFDSVLILILLAYICYGYFSGGHKQIRLSINLILPFVIIYYMGRNITKYLYDPLSNTLLYEVIAELTPIFKYTLGMLIAYFITYFLLFFIIFLLSLYAKKYILNENMRAKLGKKNNIIGGIFAFINGYVLIYFLILPALSLNLVGTNAHATNFVLEHPPPFSRIARTAETAVPIKNLADKAEEFQQLLSVEGIEGYYNDAIYTYQQQYVGASDSYEAQFMNDVYPELTDEARQLVEDAYFDLYGTALMPSNYFGVSIALIYEQNDRIVYELMLQEENAFDDKLDMSLQIMNDHENAIDAYEIALKNYNYQVAYNQYISDLEQYTSDLEDHLNDKLDAFKTGTDFTDEFNHERPVLTIEKPDPYQEVSVTNVPVDPEENVSQEVIDAEAFINRYQNKEDIKDELSSLSRAIYNHRGLVQWFVEEFNEGTVFNPDQGDISPVIVSFKEHYDDIESQIDDDTLKTQLYQVRMSVQTYDVFTLWLSCTEDNIANVPLDELENANHRCDQFDTSTVTTYDFDNNALRVVSTLFEGEQVSWIIMQYKYDYEAGLFDEAFQEYQEVSEILTQTKSLVDEYDLYYKDIASSIEGNVSMVVKIGISVMKYHLDVYDTMQNTPLLSALFNDMARMCASRETSPINPTVDICMKSEGDSGLLSELFNMQYLTSEVAIKAYVMIDENNETITYDTQTMETFLAKLNQSVEDDVLTKEVIAVMGDQFAFNIPENANESLLEQMYHDGDITIEAMRMLADDDYELFSDAFTQCVKSLIR
ncbi:MAG: CvpA family protein [Candidatus Izemoplasma sp.]|nr:CvpA family protein [Candidatus Izemoplasma sp.]